MPRGQARSRRTKQRKLLAEARERALTEHVPAYGIDPAEALQEILESALGQLRVARERSSKLDLSKAGAGQDAYWRDTMVGRIPNEWVRHEADLRAEVASLAGRMVGLDIAGRRAAAAEALAEAIAPALENVFKTLRLSAAQRDKARSALEAELQVIEAPGARQLEEAA